MGNILKVVSYPDKRLATPCEIVTEFDDAFRARVDDVKATHYSLTDCAALAANQVGIMERFTVIDFEDNLTIIVNGEIYERDGEESAHEGCMSILPGKIKARVPRATTIKIRFQDVWGEKHDETYTGFMARVVQHELDHLDGKVYIDYLNPFNRERVELKITKLLRRRQRGG